MTLEINDVLIWQAEGDVTIFGLNGATQGGSWMITNASGVIEVANKESSIFLSDKVLRDAIEGADSIGIGTRQAIELTLAGMIGKADFEKACITYEGQICFTGISIGDYWMGDMYVTNE